MRKVHFLLPILTLIYFTAALFAAPGRRGPRAHRPSGPSLEMLADELGLTDDQARRLRDIRFNSEKEAIALRAKIKSAELDFKRLMQESEPDEDKIRDKISEVGELKTTLRIKQVMSRLAAQKVLTAEQREKAEKLKRERRQRKFRRRRMERDPLGDLDFDDNLFEPEVSESPASPEAKPEPESGI